MRRVDLRFAEEMVDFALLRSLQRLFFFFFCASASIRPVCARVVHIRRQESGKQRIGRVIVRGDIVPRLSEVIRGLLEVPRQPREDLEEVVSRSKTGFVFDVDLLVS